MWLFCFQYWAGNITYLLFLSTITNAACIGDLFCVYPQINLQEESCIRIASFLSDGIVVEPGVVLPDTSLNAMYFSLKEFDLTVPVTTAVPEEDQDNGEEGFTGARLHVEGFMIAQSPFLNFKLLNLDKDAACFTMWKGQPVDSSQQRYHLPCTTLVMLELTGQLPFNCCCMCSLQSHRSVSHKLTVETGILL